MRSSNKSRSRNKNINTSSSSSSRRGNTGNIVNRVFDSAGPEGKVRGTPQQIIEKYQSLSHDAQMAGDRIASENFAQYAEHYTRMLGSAQREIREIAERRDQMEAQRRDSEPNGAEAQPRSSQHDAQPRPVQQDTRMNSDQPDVSNVSGGDLFPASDDDDSNLVLTPENAEPKPVRKAAPRKRKPVQKPAAVEAQPVSSDEPIVS